MSIRLQLCFLCVLCVSYVISNENFQCSNNSCCYQHANGNPSTGNGYLQFNEDCLNGGPNCVDNSGCELCFQNGFDPNQNLGNRPVCDQCQTTICCIVGNQYGYGTLEFNPICFINPFDELNCFGGFDLYYPNPYAGCEFCVEKGMAPHGAELLPGLNITCSYCLENQCCALQANPNPRTGNGFQQFTPNCLYGGSNCVDSTGCELCFVPAQEHVNVGNRPYCQT